jgi:hypothetical protein
MTIFARDSPLPGFYSRPLLAAFLLWRDNKVLKQRLMFEGLTPTPKAYSGLAADIMVPLQTDQNHAKDQQYRPHQP